MCGPPEESIRQSLKDIFQTEDIIRAIIAGRSLEEVSSTFGIPAWQITLRIANFGSQAVQLAAFRCAEPIGGACEIHCTNVISFTERQSKVVAMEAMAGMMTGMEYPWALLMAECNCARAIAESDEDESSTGDGSVGDRGLFAKSQKAAKEDGANGAKDEGKAKGKTVTGEAGVKKGGAHAGTAAEGKKSPILVLNFPPTGKARPVKHTHAPPA
ncbi:hypothetical protein PV08_04311 [Exophiala spinifera]|uniref:Uncharacterized protein n=1 Tax=Exophiala spinifera TaxID=91928 RepID=A0A0D2BET4_9EURO|nr:uncharacterized protein PV08_04311 [Exophiala spinifera]KIW17120.1 hypothetical protein PV08_04311 [Exophiala spinifera]